MRLRGSVGVCFVEVWYEEWELGFFILVAEEIMLFLPWLSEI